MTEVMFVKIHGPDGREVEPGQPVPTDWDRDYVASLVADGAAGVPTPEQVEQFAADDAIRNPQPVTDVGEIPMTREPRGMGA